MIDDKKIEEAAINKCGFISSEFYSGAKWMQEEFLKDLWHPASEEPREKAMLLIEVFQTLLRESFIMLIYLLEKIGK